MHSCRTGFPNVSKLATLVHPLDRLRACACHVFLVNNLGPQDLRGQEGPRALTVSQFDGGFAGLPRLIATSWYNSLQVRFQKRTSHYLSFEGNYTFSKATDDSAAGRNAWLTNLEFDNPQLLDDLKAEHGISANDATHRLTVAIILDLPIGRGRWVGSGMNNIADAIVGGWSLESFLTLQSGQPIAIVMADGGRLTDGNTQGPNVICSQLTTGIDFHEAARTGGTISE